MFKSLPQMFYWLICVIDQCSRVSSYSISFSQYTTTTTTMYEGTKLELCLTLSRGRFLSYRNQSID